LTPEQLARSGSEHGEQMALFAHFAAERRAGGRYLETETMFAVPNGREARYTRSCEAKSRRRQGGRVRYIFAGRTRRLSWQLGIERDVCHFGMFDQDTAERSKRAAQPRIDPVAAPHPAPAFSFRGTLRPHSLKAESQLTVDASNRCKPGGFKMPTSTPWGPSQYKKNYGRGINFYGTASHGGFKVSTKLNTQMPEVLRYADGWYEEDNDWARVAVAYPDRFTAAEFAEARLTLRESAPEAYEAHFGEILQPGESRVRDEQVFAALNKDNQVVVSATTVKDDPATVIVMTTTGGVRREPEWAAARYFKVPTSEYERRMCQHFVVDLVRHPEVSKAEVRW
jgi:hypothetical protein